jgi:hypothetical protein
VPTKEEAARELANKHYEIEPSVTQIFTVCDRPELEVLPTEPIKLLEVNENTIASGIMPLGFDAAPASGIPYPAVIIEVTPDEMKKIQSNELSLPHGWQLGALLPRVPEAVR